MRQRSKAAATVVFGSSGKRGRDLALPGLEAPLRLINDVHAALTAHDAIVAVTAAQRFQ
jgi:hypothetical protein